LKHYQQTEAVPPLFALGFAGYLLFMKSVKQENGQYFGKLNDHYYKIQDDMAAQFYKRWNNLQPKALVEEVLRDKAFWGEDLSILPGFGAAVTEKLELMLKVGVREAMEPVLQKKIAV